MLHIPSFRSSFFRWVRKFAIILVTHNESLSFRRWELLEPTFSKPTNPTASRWDFLISTQQNLFVARGIFRRWLLSCILMGRVVGLLHRAEESCEGLKHSYYNLPCIHFLIFLCHDIKNKIDRLFLFFCYLKNSLLLYSPIKRVIGPDVDNFE